MMNNVTFFKVGGCVRDRLMGRESDDIDFTVEAPSFDAMRNALLEMGYTIFLEKPEFLTIRARSSEGETHDFVLARKEGAYSDSRHPDEVEPGTIDDDLARRDFTMNAIAERPDGTLYDPFGGIHDILDLRLIRTVGDPRVRFKEDALRMLRALRFSVTLEMDIHAQAQWVMDHEPDIYKGLKNIPAERMMNELNKMFDHDILATFEVFRNFPTIENIVFSAPGLKLKSFVRKD